MPGGRVLGSAFLAVLALIAFLSAIGALEAIVGSISEMLDIKSSRTKVILVFLVIEALVMMPSALDPSIVGTLDLIFGSGMQLLGSLIAIITVDVGPRVGRKRRCNSLPIEIDRLAQPLFPVDEVDCPRFNPGCPHRLHRQ